jgi:hypothetical protein
LVLKLIDWDPLQQEANSKPASANLNLTHGTEPFLFQQILPFITRLSPTNQTEPEIWSHLSMCWGTLEAIGDQVGLFIPSNRQNL